MFYERKRMELFSSPGDISLRLDGDHHSRGEAIPDSRVHYKVYTYSAKCATYYVTSESSQTSLVARCVGVSKAPTVP